MSRLLVLAGKIVTPDKNVKAVDAEGISPVDSKGCCLLVEDKKIAEIGPYAELKAKYPDAEEVGSLDYWAMPGFTNGHFHTQSGYQLRYGIREEPLETWLLRCYSQLMGTKTPELPYLESLYTNLKMLLSGVTSAVDFYVGVNEDSEFIGCEGGLRAAVDSGMRIAVAPTGRDADADIVYGSNEEFLKGMAPEMAKIARERKFGFTPMDPKKFLDGWDRVYNAFHNYDDRVSVFICPDGPQWATAELFKAISEKAYKYGVKMQTHCMETRYQLMSALNKYGGSYINYMDSIGVLNDRLTLGHGTWLRNEDIELCAKRGVAVSHNPGANLRLHSGIAPLRDYLDAGVTMAIGTDNHSFSSDNDYFAEMRLAMLLHRGAGMDAPCVEPEEIFRVGTEGGAALKGEQDKIGKLLPGMYADIVLIDPTNCTGPFIHPDISAAHAVLDKAVAADVRTVLVNGEVLVKDGKLTKYDLEEVREEYAYYGRKAWKDDPGDYGEAMEATVEACKAWFRKQERELPINYQYNTK